jgi:porphobilinogen synthase
MPGVEVLAPNEVSAEAQALESEGIKAVLLFGVPRRKDERGSGAWAEDGVVQEATRAIKSSTGLVIITDLCLCEYTEHGHCGVLNGGRVDNDSTLELYALTALAQAEAGADIVAPSGMMDGQVAALRGALDDGGLQNTAILSYAAKYATAFYGPFRDAAGSAPKSGDRRSHQMDVRNSQEAMREIALDLEEGADIIMVKPALPCLDIISQARRFEVPLAAYQVSGEYAMLKAAAAQGWLDEERCMMESLLAIKRAGASMIVTYYARQAAAALGRR